MNDALGNSARKLSQDGQRLQPIVGHGSGSFRPQMPLRWRQVDATVAEAVSIQQSFSRGRFAAKQEQCAGAYLRLALLGPGELV
jgi:hypothetical protein